MEITDWQEDAARCDAFWLLVYFDLPHTLLGLTVDAFLPGGQDYEVCSDML